MVTKKRERIFSGDEVSLGQAFTIVNIKAGFSKCGIYPFNPDTVAKYKMLPCSMHGNGSSSIPLL